jgi:tripartite-type tricarboxylate transporter receptor subunit TctC
MSRILKLALGVVLAVAFVAPSLAQNFPSRPLRIIVPFPAGGPSDSYARAIASRLSESLRQPVVVENIAGGNSVIGTVAAAKSPPDGYTLLMISNTHTTIESLIAGKPYQLLRDFVPVASINRVDLVMIVPESVPATTLRDFIGLAKSRPKGLIYASSGPGSPYHMAGELFKTMSGTDLVHVPYKSSANARMDLLGGQLHMMFDAVPSAAESIRSGKVRALATTGRQRSPSLPDVPTIAEAGLPEYEAVLWTGIMVPARTPRDIVERLNSDINQVITRPDFIELWARQGATPMAMSLSEFAKYVSNDIDRWTQVVKASGIRVD